MLFFTATILSMTKISLHEEVKNVLSHYSTIFSYYIKLFILVSILLISIDIYFGAYVLSLIHLTFTLPVVFLFIINYKKIKNALVPFYLIIIVLVSSFFIMFFGGMIYNLKFPYIAFWFILILYIINTINLQKNAIFIHLLTFLTVYCIFFVPFFDFSYLAEENINYKYFQVSHVVVMLFTLIYLEYINNKLFQKLLIDLYLKNRQLEKMNKEQLDIQKIKNDFFATISHEMRTPLNAIHAISEIESNTNFLNHKELEENKTILNYSSRHLINLINDVLDFSKINLGEFELFESKYNLKEAIEMNFKLNVKGNIKEMVEFFLLFNCNLPKFVIIDLQRFNQILINLMSNAFKFTNKGSVKIIIDGDYHPTNKLIFNLKLSIIDTGIGISKENIEKIYDKHFQNISNQLGGFGLGLFIVKQIVQKMMGTIEVSSTISKGTNFTVNLPIKVSIDIEDEQIIRNEVSKIGNNLKILIVDDNKINQKVLKKILESNLNSENLFYCNDGIEVLDFIEKNEVDIILMDLLMPNLDGFECSKIIRNHKNKKISSIPIIIITANVWENDFEHFIANGINDFITKPIDINLLLNKISKCINQ